MASPRLRIYHGPEEATTPSAVPPKRQIQVTLGEICPLLADATQSRRGWLLGFADDQVTISSDLYEVLVAYRHLERPSA